MQKQTIMRNNANLNKYITHSGSRNNNKYYRRCLFHICEIPTSVFLIRRPIPIPYAGGVGSEALDHVSGVTQV